MIGRRWRPAAAVIGLSLAGCATIPSSGAVHVGRVINAQDPVLSNLRNVKTSGSGPTDNMTRPQVVRGFLDALAIGETAIAKEYLGGAATVRWHPSETITAYRDLSVRLAPGGDVSLRARTQGQLDPATGDWESSGQRLTRQFKLARIAGQWRITALPSQRLYDTQDVSDDYAEYSLQFLNSLGTTLVPQPIVLATNVSGLATALVQAMLNGPEHSTAGAITTDIPVGTQLNGNVGLDVTGTIAEVDLSSQIRGLPAAKLAVAIAQITQTLEQLPGISAVRIEADNEPLVVPKTVTGDQLTKPTSAKLTAVLADGSGREFSSVNPAIGRRWPAVEELALGPGGQAAGVAGSVGHERLLIGSTHGRPRLVLRGAAIDSVQYAGSSVTAVLDGTSVVSVHRRDVKRWQLPRSVTRVGVRALAVAPDGVRVALLVGRPGAVTPKVGVVTSTGRLVGLRRLSRPAGVLTGIAWGGESDISVLSRSRGRSEITDSDAVGFASHRLRAPGHGDATGLCSNPDGSIAVVVGRELWVQVDGHWRRSGRAVGCA